MKDIVFGEIEYIKDECPVGLVLREGAEGVVLERYFDTEWRNMDVVETFDPWLTLASREGFEQCLKVAREYESDMDVTIYIKHFSEEAREKAAAVNKGNMRRTCCGCSEHIEKKYPWEQIDWNKCKNCKIYKGFE